jgi:hypothetical protein
MTARLRLSDNIGALADSEMSEWEKRYCASFTIWEYCISPLTSNRH